MHKQTKSIPSPHEKIAQLEDEIARLKKKILAQETATLTVKNQKAKADHKTTVLQAKYDKLKKERFKPMVTFEKNTHN